MSGTASPFNDIARQALAAYELPRYHLAFIRHSDTVTFKIEVPGGEACLLRIHVPVSGAMGSHGADAGAITSELLWLEALSRDTGLVLQRPVRNRAGALVTQLPAANCSLLRWVAGQPYQRELESESTATQIGEILARLHQHASQWPLPAGFRRPKRDIAYFEAVLRGLGPAVQAGQISPADYAEFETSIALLAGMLRAQIETRHSHGLMHADTHKGNMLYHDGQIRLIDFSFCAVGNYMFDLGVCLSDMKEQLQPAFLAGYQRLRPLPDGYERLVEGFFVGSMVGTFSYWVANPRAQALLVSKAPQIARDYAARFNRGEYFWFR